MILVTDASQRVSLEVIRCLGEGNLDVITVERTGLSSSPIASYSKYCKEFVKIESYFSTDFIDLYNRAECVIPISTNTIIAISKQITAGVLSKQKCLLPVIDVFKKFNNKFELVKFAKKIGAPVPETSLLKYDKFSPLAGIGCRFPIVLKLANDEGLYLNPADRYAIVRTEQEYEKAFFRLSKYKKDILLQEYIDGGAFGWSALCDKQGNRILSFAHQRLREYPLSGGPSTCCISVNIPELNTIGEKFLSAINWQGPIMIEFKRDNKSGEFKIIEINPRYWGSIPLARRCGLNIPLYHYNIIMDTLPALIRTEYKTGVKINFLPLEIKYVISVLQSDMPKTEKISALLCVIKDIVSPTVHDGIWDLSDPMPVLKKILHL